MPPLPAITEPMDMLPDTTEQFTQLLLFMAKVPVGGDGVVHGRHGKSYRNSITPTSIGRQNAGSYNQGELW